MVYLGRILGIGLNIDGKPVAVYGLTGRSEPSKQRIARVIADDFIPRVHIEAHGKPSPEQLKQANLLFYDAITAFVDIYKGHPYLAISNGVQTNHFADRTSAWPLADDSLIEALKYMKHEPDRPIFTSRIAGEILFHRQKYNCPIARLGMITENQRDTAEFLLNQHDIGAGEGGVKIISTYTGEDDKNPAAPFWAQSLEDVVTSVHLKGDTAEELAEDVYNWLDEKYRVSAAAAVWNGKNWELAVKNLHEQKVE